MPDDRAEINSVEKVTALLVSAYPTGCPAVMMEMSSDNTMDNGKQWSARSQVQEDAYLWKDITTTDNDTPQDIWNNHYLAVAAANQVLAAIEEMGNPENLQAQKGEALLCRAYSMFAMSNVFCLPYNPDTAGKDFGLPYPEKPETQVLGQYERGTMAELYEKIDNDIKAGLALVNDQIYTVPKYHFNKKAAYAFAARFNLYYQKPDKVIEYANVVLGNNAEAALRNWYAIYSAASDVSLRVNMYVNDSENANLLIMPTYSPWAYMHGPYNQGRRYGNSRTLFMNESARVTGLWGVYTNRFYPAASVWGYEEKFSMAKISIGYFEYTDKVQGIGYVHTMTVPLTADETLLCRAEAYILKKDYANAVADINAWIHTHSVEKKMFTQDEIVDFYDKQTYMPTVPASATDRKIKKKINPQGFTIEAGVQENLIQCILHLRRIETMHEGLRWQDIKRYGIEISHNRDGLTPDILTVNDLRRAIQIPQDVISAGLTANPR
ncbi:hypothetical protein FACS1894169_11940 [Bacteroidia bacterium]|nr:hypothetical protein FACS1894169_11940 [Bacteroidia bacterium]